MSAHVGSGGATSSGGHRPPAHALLCVATASPVSKRWHSNILYDWIISRAEGATEILSYFTVPTIQSHDFQIPGLEKFDSFRCHILAGFGSSVCRLCWRCGSSVWRISQHLVWKTSGNSEKIYAIPLPQSRERYEWPHHQVKNVSARQVYTYVPAISKIQCAYFNTTWNLNVKLVITWNQSFIYDFAFLTFGARATSSSDFKPKSKIASSV